MSETLFDQVDHHAGEVIDHDDRDLVVRTTGPALAPLTQPGIGGAFTAQQLALLEDGAQLFERYARVLEQIWMVGLSRTLPNDWVLQKSGESTTAMFCSTGYPAIAEIYGFDVEFGPRDSKGNWAPKRVQHETAPGIYGYEGWARGRSRMSGQSSEVIATRWNNEQFAGRLLDDKGEFVKKNGRSLDSDLKAAVMSRLKAAMVNSLTGIKTVSQATLEAAWASQPSKKIEHCRKGHGFGTSDDRRASATGGGGDDLDLNIEREVLRKVLLQATGGSLSDAASLLKDLTSWGDPPNQKWFQSVDRMTRDFQFKQAWERLAKHEIFKAACPSPAQLDKIRAEVKAAAAAPPAPAQTTPTTPPQQPSQQRRYREPGED